MSTLLSPLMYIGHPALEPQAAPEAHSHPQPLGGQAPCHCVETAKPAEFRPICIVAGGKQVLQKFVATHSKRVVTEVQTAVQEFHIAATQWYAMAQDCIDMSELNGGESFEWNEARVAKLKHVSVRCAEYTKAVRRFEETAVKLSMHVAEAVVYQRQVCQQVIALDVPFCKEEADDKPDLDSNARGRTSPKRPVRRNAKKQSQALPE
jgi:hypothetical protein